MDWTVMDDPSHHRFPPNGTLEAPLPPVRGFFFAARIADDVAAKLSETIARYWSQSRQSLKSSA
jgi:hypothetical protein